MFGYVDKNNERVIDALPDAVQRERLWAQMAVPISVLISLVAVFSADGHLGLVIPLQIPPLAVIALNGLWKRLPSVVLAVGVSAAPIVLSFLDVAEGAHFYMVLVAMLIAAHESSRLQADVIVALLFFQPLLATITVDIDAGWQFWMMGVFFGWAFGTMGRTNGELLDQLGASRKQVADQAVALERRRIARDIHDLVGHSLTVVLLHVTGARRAIHRNPQVAEEALESAERVGRESLAEIRRSVNLLREDTGETQPSPEGADIVDLVEQSRSAGQAVTLSVEGDLSVVRGAVGLTVYRVLQESLNNAAKHAPDAEVAVDVRVTEDSCVLLVDNGAGGPAMRLGEGGGFGLLAMRERVQAVDGTLVVGPAGSRWRVEASIPLIDHLNRPISEPEPSNTEGTVAT